MASNIENDFRLALIALKNNTLNAYEKSFIKGIETYSKKELTSMSGKQKKLLSDIAFKGVEKPRESKMNIEQRISMLEKRILKESPNETIISFLRKNHVSPGLIIFLKRKYKGIDFEINLKDFLQEIQSDYYGEVVSGSGILLTLIPGTRDTGEVTTHKLNRYFLKNRKDYIFFLRAIQILGAHYSWFLNSHNKRVIARELNRVDPEGDF